MNYRTRTSLAAHQVEEIGSPVVDRKIVDKVWMTTNRDFSNENVPIMKALTAFNFGMENHNVVAEQKCVVHGDGPFKHYKVEA